MNVLIYAGEGTSVESTRQTKECLRALLSPHYAVSEVSDTQLLSEPWQPFTAMLVVPGGADLPYCKALNGAGTEKIRRYVRSGGRYLGICAGGYFGASYCEFERGTDMEVSGPRELAFYNGTARGTVFKGFQYGSHAGARAVNLKTATGDFKCYYNGGCLFAGSDPNIEVLASYLDEPECQSDDVEAAAVIFKKFGSGKVVLTGPHFEYDVTRMDSDDLDPKIVDQVAQYTEQRLQFTKMMLEKLGLHVADTAEGGLPRATPLITTCLDAKLTPNVEGLLENLQDNVEDGKFEDRENTFRFYSSTDVVPATDSGDTAIVAYTDSLPEPRLTPYLNHRLYYKHLAEEEAKRHHPRGLGRLMMYGEIIGSTSTTMDRNPQFLRRLPHGTITVATIQTAGRGRGKNAWVSPVGGLPVSGVLRVPVAEVRQSLVFVQYLVSMAVVESIHSFGKEYEALDVRLKWPNDTYIAKDGGYAKIGGVITSCNVLNKDFVLVFGAGTNIDNPLPTTSINSSIADLNARTGSNLAPISIEAFLAKLCTSLDEMFTIFLAHGFQPFEERYYRYWLHSGKEVTLETQGNVRVKIRGITHDTGMLLVSGLDQAGRPTEQTYEVQPDGNSFDMLRGLIRKKEL